MKKKNIARIAKGVQYHSIVRSQRLSCIQVLNRKNCKQYLKGHMSLALLLMNVQKWYIVKKIKSLKIVRKFIYHPNFKKIQKMLDCQKKSKNHSLISRGKLGDPPGLDEHLLAEYLYRFAHFNDQSKQFVYCEKYVHFHLSFNLCQSIIHDSVSLWLCMYYH